MIRIKAVKTTKSAQIVLLRFYWVYGCMFACQARTLHWGDSVGPDLIAGLWQAFVTEPLNYYCILELE
jgi:hypothetical protein